MRPIGNLDFLVNNLLISVSFDSVVEQGYYLIVEKIRVLVADDHPIVRNGLSQLCEVEEDLECIAKVEDGEQAIRLTKELVPDVAIIDIAMPKVNGIEAAKQIKADCPTTAVLVISAYKYDYYILACFKAGIDGYLLKDTPPAEIANAIRTVHAGKGVFDLEATGKLMHDLATNKDMGSLGSIEMGVRELEVLKLAAKGWGNKEIADKLCISEHTVGSHFAHIFRKLGVTSRTEALLYALKQGWFNINDLG